jgi:hypothetical protein
MKVWGSNSGQKTSFLASFVTVLSPPPFPPPPTPEVEGSLRHKVLAQLFPNQKPRTATEQQYDLIRNHNAISN